MRLKAKYYIDFVVENQVIVELKSVAEVAQGPRVPSAHATEAHGLPVGLLINFNVPLLVDGVTRIVNPTLKSRETENT